MSAVITSCTASAFAPSSSATSVMLGWRAPKSRLSVSSLTTTLPSRSALSLMVPATVSVSSRSSGVRGQPGQGVGRALLPLERQHVGDGLRVDGGDADVAALVLGAREAERRRRPHALDLRRLAARLR